VFEYTVNRFRYMLIVEYIISVTGFVVLPILKENHFHFHKCTVIRCSIISVI